MKFLTLSLTLAVLSIEASGTLETVLFWCVAIAALLGFIWEKE